MHFVLLLLVALPVSVRALAHLAVDYLAGSR